MSTEIPEQHTGLLKRLSELPQSDLDEINAAVGSLEPNLSPSSMGKRLAAVTSLDVDFAQSLLRAATGMYWGLATSGMTTGKFASQLTAEMRKRLDERDSEDEKWSRFEHFLGTLLAQDRSIGIAAKGLRLLFDHQRTFEAATIATDLRPVFIGDSDGEIGAAIIAHELKIAYRNGDASRHIYLALDSEDIQLLKRALERAESKEKAIASLAASAEIPYLRVESPAED